MFFEQNSFKRYLPKGFLMKNSTLKRLKRKQDNLPLHFIDSSVFLEIVFEQKYHKICSSFLNEVYYKSRLITSTLVLGEVLKSLQGINNDRIREHWLLFFSQLLRDKNIELCMVSFASLKNLAAIQEIERFLASSDSLIFSTALAENCSVFVTLDNDFSIKLGRELDIIIKKPFDI